MERSLGFRQSMQEIQVAGCWFLCRYSFRSVFKKWVEGTGGFISDLWDWEECMIISVGFLLTFGNVPVTLTILAWSNADYFKTQIVKIER